jgi:hypothetical protein
MKLLLLIPLILLAGCRNTNQRPPEDMVLIGTMSVYRTQTGALTVMHDQTHQAIAIEWNIRQVLIKQEIPKPSKQ